MAQAETKYQFQVEYWDETLRTPHKWRRLFVTAEEEQSFAECTLQNLRRVFPEGNEHRILTITRTTMQATSGWGTLPEIFVPSPREEY